MRAKKAFQSNDTAPSGARSVMDSAPIWKTLPSTFDVMKIANPSSHSLKYRHIWDECSEQVLSASAVVSPMLLQLHAYVLSINVSLSTRDMIRRLTDVGNPYDVTTEADVHFEGDSSVVLLDLFASY